MGRDERSRRAPHELVGLVRDVRTHESVELVGERAVRRDAEGHKEDSRKPREQGGIALSRQGKVGTEVRSHPLSFKRREREPFELEPRLGITAPAEVVERPQHSGSAAVEILERARRSPAIPGIGTPEELRPAQSSIGVRDDFLDPGTDPRLVPRLVGERLEILGPVEQRGQATSRTRCASASARSFFSPWCSIWRMRSRVTLNARPTSSSVLGCWPSSP